MSEDLKKPEKVYMKGFDQVCVFDAERDVQEVVSGLAVDITDALQTGIVKDSTYLEDSNGISEPAQILGRISDPFDAIEASRAVRKYGKRAQPSVAAAIEPASAGDASKSE